MVVFKRDMDFRQNNGSLTFREKVCKKRNEPTIWGVPEAALKKRSLL